MAEKNIHKNKSKTISNYNKKHLLRGLIETNANPEKQQIVFGRFLSISKDPSVARDYINERANESQKRVEYLMKQNNNKSFDILNKNAITLNNKHNPIISVALETITEYENHPSKDELNGIDLKQLYKWMANLLAGYPVDIKEGPTKDFLENCYKELIESTKRNSLENLKEDLRRQNQSNEDFFIQYSYGNYDDLIESLTLNNNNNN